MLKFKCPACSGDIDKMSFLLNLKRDYKCRKCNASISSSTTLYVTVFISIFLGLILSNMLAFIMGKLLLVTPVLNLFAQIVTVMVTWLAVTIFFPKLGKVRAEE